MSEPPSDRQPPAPPHERKPTSPAPGAPQPARRVSSEQLFGAATELEIDHRGATYRLRQTAFGKLILTK